MSQLYMPKEVRQEHARALALLLLKREPGAPEHIIALGHLAAQFVFESLGAFLPDMRPSMLVHKIHVSEDGAETITGAEDFNQVKGKRVLVVCGHITHGQHLAAVIEALQSFHPREIITYGLVVSARAGIIPNYSGVVIAPHDTIHFLDVSLPVRIRVPPSGTACLRILSRRHFPMLAASSGLPSLDAETWAGRYYDMINSSDGRVTYVLEDDGRILAYLTYRFHRPDSIMVEEVAVDKAQAGGGIGGHLMRWVSDVSRACACQRILLWAIDNRVPWYESMGFWRVEGEVIDIDNEKYLMMTARVPLNEKSDWLYLPQKIP